jgi:hypothetical protein
MGFDLGNFLSGAAKAAGDAVQTVEKIPGASDAIKSVAGSVGVDPSIVQTIADAGTKIANSSPVISAAGNLGKDIPGFAHGFAVGVGTMQTPIEKAQHLAVLRGSLPANGQQGFDTAVALHVGGIRRPAPPLPPKARAAYQITHGMVGAPVAQKDLMMESIAVDSDARPGAVQAIREVASDRETLWEKLMNAAGFHGSSDRSNRDYKFGQDDDDGDGGDDGGGDDGGDDGGGDDGGGGGGGGGGDDGAPQQPKKHHHKHHPHHRASHRGGHPAAPRGGHHGEVMTSSHGQDPYFPHPQFDHRFDHRFEHHPYDPYAQVAQPAAPFAPYQQQVPMPPGPPGYPYGYPPAEGPSGGTKTAENIFDPLHLFHTKGGKGKSVGQIAKSFLDPLHIFGDPDEREYHHEHHRHDEHHRHHHDGRHEERREERRGFFADFGKHHHKKHKDQMGVELPPSARMFGAEAYRMGHEIGCAMGFEASLYPIAGELQTDPQGHVALYGAQHDPRDWDLTADPLLEINSRVAVWPSVDQHLEDEEDATAERASVEGIMP